MDNLILGQLVGDLPRTARPPLISQEQWDAERAKELASRRARCESAGESFDAYEQDLQLSHDRIRASMDRRIKRLGELGIS